MATPALRAIRTHFADATISFLMEPNLSDLVGGGNWMDDGMEWPARPRRSPFHRAYRELVSHIRRRNFEWVVLLPNSFRSALLARLSGAPRRIGYDRDRRGFLLTDRIPVRNRRQTLSRRADPERSSDPDGANEYNRLHPPAPPGHFVPMPIVAYYADLAEFLGCPRPGDVLELFTTSDCEASMTEKLSNRGIADAHPLVVLSPGAKYGAAKCWPVDRFAGVADRLIDAEHARVVVTCGPGEEPIARAIASQMKQTPVLFDDPLLSLGELKSLVKRTDLLIGNDAGPRHIAKAFNVPVITIFGPTHPDWTATTYPDERIVRINVDCGPCQQRTCPLGHLKCMTGVSVEMVLDAARDLLSSRAARIDAPSSTP